MTSNQKYRPLNPLGWQYSWHFLDINHHRGTSDPNSGGYYTICWRGDKKARDALWSR